VPLIVNEVWALSSEVEMTASPDGNGYQAEALLELIDSMRDQHPTAQNLVLETLRAAILEGILPPASRLRQEDLAKAFKTSRIPVREALRVLEYEGLARSEPHRGFTVTALDADQIEEIYELRTVLESHAVRVAIPLLTQPDLDDLQRLYDGLELIEAADEKLARREQFYLRLYGVTARPRLVGLIARLHQEVARSLRWQLIEQSPSHHELFFDAVKAGEADLAAAELGAHYRKVVALQRRFLREAKKPQAVGR
jgi:DNA-binding GntR family transcriptional regulator